MEKKRKKVINRITILTKEITKNMEEHTKLLIKLNKVVIKRNTMTKLLITKNTMKRKRRTNLQSLERKKDIKRATKRRDIITNFTRTSITENTSFMMIFIRVVTIVNMVPHIKNIRKLKEATKKERDINLVTKTKHMERSMRRIRVIILMNIKVTSRKVGMRNITNITTIMVK